MQNVSVICSVRNSRNGRSLSDYVEVEKTNPAIARLCGTSDDTVDHRLKAMREALCTTEAAVSSYDITMSDDGRTACGTPSEEIIACGSPGKGIEINSKDFKFTGVDQQNAVLGSGTIEVDLLKVLLHETGHWIGFEHVSAERYGDLMFGTYTSNMCLSDRNVRDMETVSFRENKSANPAGLMFKK